MKKSFLTMIGISFALIFAAAGCGSSEKVAEVTPTPVATATPTPTPAPTVTPRPAVTPLPRLIGVKTSKAKLVYLINSMKADVNELYIRNSGDDEWGKDLIPTEVMIKASEQVRLYYTPDSDEEDAVYDMKLVTRDGDTYVIYSAELGDMEKASLNYDAEEDMAYLRYMSLSAKKEMNTKENLQQSSDDDDDDDYYYSDNNYSGNTSTTTTTTTETATTETPGTGTTETPGTGTTETPGTETTETPGTGTTETPGTGTTETPGTGTTETPGTGTTETPGTGTTETPATGGGITEETPPDIEGDYSTDEDIFEDSGSDIPWEE